MKYSLVYVGKRVTVEHKAAGMQAHTQHGANESFSFAVRGGWIVSAQSLLCAVHSRLELNGFVLAGKSSVRFDGALA
ncbi:hypothetical protein [Xanthomonas albilineans]|uniref:hypothetical protein n=1 Tax=Xanthomonas albilineans TaxID=29447 RepID=UPI0012D3ECAB|nr:hypothetical protein [Xanthomonas albilineans]